MEQVCQAALEQGEAGQTAFLVAACAGDDDLRREVESLLAHRWRADRFIEEPALEAAGRALADEPGWSIEADETPEEHLDPHAASGGPRQSGLGAALATDRGETAGTVIERYRLLQKIGQGGMDI